jgi:cytoskeleton protein RodZ
MTDPINDPMSDSPQQSTDADPSSPIAGGRLAIARRENRISAAEIAKELHLDEPTVLALEQNNFEMLGAPVFAKGHLRKYAELVGIPVDDILADYYQLNRSAGAPPVVGAPRKTTTPVSLAPWIVTALVLAGSAIAAYWWYNNRGPAQPVARTAPAELAPVAAQPVGRVVQDTTDAEPEIVSEALPVAVPHDLPAAGNENETAGMEPESLASDLETAFVAASTLPQVRVELSFYGDCWTEVSDASGRRLFYDLGQDGRVVSLSGDAPLQIVLGNSENVSLAVEGQEYPVPAPARPGLLTRLTINRP